MWFAVLRCGCPFVALCAASATIACSGPDRRSHAPGTRDRSASAARLPIRYSDERLIDVTGDSVRDRIVVTATGPSYDSLDVVLEIQSEDGTPLYTDRWSSRRYFAAAARAALTDSAARSVVLARLGALLADSAFTRTGDTSSALARVDTGTVEHDLREILVRARHMLPDTVRLRGALANEVGRMTIPRTRLDSVLTAIHRKPRFTYAAGDSVTYTVAWDPKLARFVRTLARP